MDPLLNTNGHESGEELWSLKVVMARTGLSRSTIYSYVADGNFPTQRRLGPRRIAWLASEVNAWIASRPRQKLLAESAGQVRRNPSVR
jgi:prophage regulatory protein